MEKKRETKRKNPEESACHTVVSQQTLDLLLCPSKIESDITRISAEVHHSRMGREKERELGGGWGRESESERSP